MLELHFKTITPLFIGNGEVLEEDFHYKKTESELKKYNQINLIADLAKNNIINFEDDKTVETLTEKISKQAYEQESFFDYTVGLDTSFTCYIANNDQNGKNAVNEFINENGRFYIPGSTIKGCLITVLDLEKSEDDTAETGCPSNVSVLEYVNDESPKRKFIIRDSEPLSSDKFEVIHYERPVYQNFIALKAGTEFVIEIPKHGIVEKKVLEDGIKAYFKSQIILAKNQLDKYEKKHKKYLPFLAALVKIEEKQDPLLINIGFGGGSWFKIKKGKIPKFNKKGRNEIPITTYYYGESPNLIHIGWCSVEIVEKT